MRTSEKALHSSTLNSDLTRTKTIGMAHCWVREKGIYTSRAEFTSGKIQSTNVNLVHRGDSRVGAEGEEFCKYSGPLG
jgi:hypothetical protein